METVMWQWVLLGLAVAERTLEELVRSGVLTPEQAQLIREETPQDSSTTWLLSSLGTVALTLLYLYVLSWTLTWRPGFSAVVNGAFSLGFYSAGTSLEVQGSALLATALLLFCYLAWSCCSVAAFACCGQGNYEALEHHSLAEVPKAQQWVSLGFSYFLARSSSYALVQLPFFLAVYMTAESLVERLGPGLRPLALAVCGAFMLLYTCIVGPAAFQLHVSPCDFQLFALLTGALLLWRGMKDLPEELEGKYTTLALWARLPAAVLLLLLGFHVPSAALIYLSLKWLSDELAAVWKREELLRGAVVVTPLVLLFLVANYSLQQVNDLFTPQMRQYLPDLLWTWVCYLLALLSSWSALLFAQGVSAVPVQVDGKLEWGRAFYKFCFCYALTMLLVVLAEEEQLWLLSLGYLVFALLTYGKALGLLLDPELGNSVMAVLALSGSRIALVGSQFLICLGLGGALMGFGTFSLSKTAKSSAAFFLLSLLLEGLLLGTALIVRSCLLLSVGLVLGLQVLSVRLSPVQMQTAVSLFVAALSLYLVQDYDWTNYAESLGRGSFLRKVLVALGDPGALVPEKDLIRRLFEAIRGFLLGLAR